MCIHINIEQLVASCTTPDRRQSKSLILSANVDKKSLEQFSIGICRPTGDKWK